MKRIGIAAGLGLMVVLAFIVGGNRTGAAPTRTSTPVEVVNFPSVQAVSGQVQVGNLPLDADGNVRVAGVEAAPNYRWIHLATAQPVSAQLGGMIEPVDVAGMTRCG